MSTPVAPEIRTKLVNEFADAIAHHEGFYLTSAECKARKIPFPTVAQRHNNPGNMRAWGSYPIVDKYAQFDNVANGWRAVRRQCERNIFERELTFYEFFAGQRQPDGTLVHPTRSYSGFAPASDDDRKHGVNNPRVYAETVFARIKASEFFKHVDWTHITTETKIKVLAS
jgi:hypothetical protein